MADKKLSELTSITSTDIASGDLLLVSDVSAGISKSITYGELTTINSVDINGGTIDGTVIGGTTPAAGSFTTLSATGDLTVDTDTLYVDSTNNRVGIGTASPSQKLHISGTGSVSSRTIATDTGGDASFFAGNDNGQIVGPLVYGSGKAAYGALGTSETALYSNRQLTIMSDNGSGIIKFATGGNTQRMLIDASGNVGIGTSLPSAKLGINASAPDFTMLQSDVVKFRSGVSGTTNGGVTGSASGDYFARTTGGKMLFSTDDGVTAHAVLDASGNLLVGKTSVDSTVAGIAARGVGDVFITRSGANPLYLNRLNNDGDIVQFAKDGATVGSIGNVGANVYIASQGAAKYVLYNSAFAALDDNSRDLGLSSQRFKDLYLSGGVYLGGTGAANKLDDYEEGTWTPSFSGTGYTFANQSGTYTKVGRKVFIRGVFDITVVGSNTSNIAFSGAPFTSSNDITNGHFIGVCREIQSNGAFFVCRITYNSSSGGINSMDGISSGDNHIFTAHQYSFSIQYETD